MTENIHSEGKNNTTNKELNQQSNSKESSHEDNPVTNVPNNSEKKASEKKDEKITNKQMLDKLSEQIVILEQQTKRLETHFLTEVKSLQNSIALLNKFHEQYINQQKQLEKQLHSTAQHISENVWASIFNNTIANSGWLKDQTFSPGRWAVGYPFLYVLYRILNEIRPKKILELGLGQSTRMLAQYSSFFKEIEHCVVEHDQAWIDFFLKDFQLSSSTSLLQLDWGSTDFHEAKNIRIYKGLVDYVKNNQFNLIVIDGPLGADMKEYSRIDTLLMLPNCLAESFIIMLDDYNRPQEQHTFAEMRRILDAANLPYKIGIYSGTKDTAVIASQDLKFVCSM